MKHDPGATDESLETLADALIISHEQLLNSLVALRKEHHLTQATVAERMGVSQPTVAAFERYDANPTLSTIRRYALAVGARMSVVVEDNCSTAETIDGRPVTPAQIEAMVTEAEAGYDTSEVRRRGIQKTQAQASTRSR